jgi:hypothetical protein
MLVSRCTPLPAGGCRYRLELRAGAREVTNALDRGTAWEGRSERVRAPYPTLMRTSWGGYLSTARPEKPCRNPGLPRSKAKNVAATDSEEVPRGKGEKNPGEGSEIEPETMCPQQVEASGNGCDGVPFVE